MFGIQLLLAGITRALHSCCHERHHAIGSSSVAVQGDSDPQRVQLSHNVNRLTKEEQHAWRCTAGSLTALLTLLTLGLLGYILVNVLARGIAEPDLQECEGSPISWLILYFGIMAAIVVVLVLRFVWLMGGMLMTNPHLVKAAAFAKRTAEGDEQTENYHRELKLGHSRQALGFSISKVSNCLMNLMVLFLVLWSCSGWVSWAQSGGTFTEERDHYGTPGETENENVDSKCLPQTDWWVIVFFATLIWAILTLILQRVQKPLI